MKKTLVAAFICASSLLLFALTSHASRATAQPITVTIAETAQATHAIDPGLVPGCFVKVHPQGVFMPGYWTYSQYDFICHMKPDEPLQIFRTYAEISECDTGDQGAYYCGLHGKDALGNPIDRPRPLALVNKDIRVVPELLARLQSCENYRCTWPADAIEEYAIAADLPAARTLILESLEQLKTLYAQAGEDVQKKAALTSLLLTLGVELSPGEGQALLVDFWPNLGPKQLTALHSITNHPNDPTIDPDKLMWFYVRNFVDNTTQKDPHRADVIQALSAVGPRMIKSSGLLFERYRTRHNWPDTLKQETEQVLCTIYRPADQSAAPSMIIVDDYGSSTHIACP